MSKNEKLARNAIRVRKAKNKRANEQDKPKKGKRWLIRLGALVGCLLLVSALVVPCFADEAEIIFPDPIDTISRGVVSVNDGFNLTPVNLDGYYAIKFNQFYERETDIVLLSFDNDDNYIQVGERYYILREFGFYNLSNTQWGWYARDKYDNFLTAFQYEPIRVENDCLLFLKEYPFITTSDVALDIMLFNLGFDVYNVISAPIGDLSVIDDKWISPSGSVAAPNDFIYLGEDDPPVSLNRFYKVGFDGFVSGVTLSDTGMIHLAEFISGRAYVLDSENYLRPVSDLYLAFMGEQSCLMFDDDGDDSDVHLKLIFGQYSLFVRDYPIQIREDVCDYWEMLSFNVSNVGNTLIYNQHMDFYHSLAPVSQNDCARVLMNYYLSISETYLNYTGIFGFNSFVSGKMNNLTDYRVSVNNSPFYALRALEEDFVLHETIYVNTFAVGFEVIDEDTYYSVTGVPGSQIDFAFAYDSTRDSVDIFIDFRLGDKFVTLLYEGKFTSADSGEFNVDFISLSYNNGTYYGSANADNINYVEFAFVPVNNTSFFCSTMILLLSGNTIYGYNYCLYDPVDFYSGYNNGYNSGNLIGDNSGYFQGYDAGYTNGLDSGYGTAYDSGFVDGYETGVDDGYEDGYVSGSNDGYSSGYSEGFDKGFGFGEDEGYQKGHSSGYEQGYSTGQNEGYTEGYTDGENYGIEYGYATGQNDGYHVGKEEGYTTGYEHGLEDGYNNGFEEGRDADAYQDGYDAAVKEIDSGEFGENFLSNSFLAPVRAMESFTLISWTTESGATYSISLMAIFSAMLGVLLFVWFLRLFSGG